MRTVTVTSRAVGSGHETEKHFFTLPDEQADVLYSLLVNVQTKSCVVFNTGISAKIYDPIKPNDTKYVGAEITIQPLRINLSYEEALSYEGPKNEKATAVFPINQDHAVFIQNLTKLATRNYALIEVTTTMPSSNGQ